MELKSIPVASIKLWEPTCRLALSNEAMVECSWRAHAETPRGLVFVTLCPSAKHPSFIHYEVWALRSGECITSREPVFPSHVGDFIASALEPWGINAARLSWRKADAKAPDSQYPKKSTNEFVYFLSAGPFVKIGKATGSPDARIRDLQTGCPYPIRLVAHVCGGLREEQTLHQRFASLRTHGEWFRHEGELAQYIQEVAEGRA